MDCRLWPTVDRVNRKHTIPLLPQVQQIPGSSDEGEEILLPCDPKAIIYRLWATGSKGLFCLISASSMINFYVLMEDQPLTPISEMETLRIIIEEADSPLYKE